MSAFTHHTTTVGDQTIHYAEAGPADAPLLLCLHGFPECWFGWADVAPHLADRWRVVLPDQRGYNGSSKPEGVANYAVHLLVADMMGLAGQLCGDRPFLLAGHDWGASIAYAMAIFHPERISRLVIANGVHPLPFQRALVRGGTQTANSQYIHRLRAPDAEERLAADGFARMFKQFDAFSARSILTAERRAAYAEAWSQPGALTAMLNWYRASGLYVPEGDETPDPAKAMALDPAALRISMPHLLIWGSDDNALVAESYEGLDALCDDLTVHPLAGCGHWLLHEEPARVAAIMRDWLE